MALKLLVGGESRRLHELNGPYVFIWAILLGGLGLLGGAESIDRRGSSEYRYSGIGYNMFLFGGFLSAR